MNPENAWQTTHGRSASRFHARKGMLSVNSLSRLFIKRVTGPRLRGVCHVPFSSGQNVTTSGREARVDMSKHGRHAVAPAGWAPIMMSADVKNVPAQARRSRLCIPVHRGFDSPSRHSRDIKFAGAWRQPFTGRAVVARVTGGETGQFLVGFAGPQGRVMSTQASHRTRAPQTLVSGP